MNLERILKILEIKDFDDADAEPTGYCGFCNRYRSDGHADNCEYLNAVEWIKEQIEKGREQ